MTFVIRLYRIGDRIWGRWSRNEAGPDRSEVTHQASHVNARIQFYAATGKTLRERSKSTRDARNF